MRPPVPCRLPSVLLLLPPLLLLLCSLAQTSLAVNATEFTFRGQVTVLEWLGQDSAACVFLTDAKQAFISTDEGATFASLTPKLVDAQKSDAPLDLVGLARPAEDEYSRMVVALSGSEHAPAFASNDAGASWTAWRVPEPPRTGAAAWGRRIVDVAFHPSAEDWVIVTTKTAGCFAGLRAEECFAAAFVSRDFGASFALLRTHVVQIDCGEGAAGEDEILACVPRRKSHQVFGVWDANVDFVTSSDDFDTYEVLVEHGNKFLFKERYTFVAAVPAHARVELHVRTSSSPGFVRTRLPFFLQSQTAFTVLDTSFGKVFLHVQEARADGFGRVFASDSTGANFSVSLPDVLRDAAGKCDFDRVLGVEGRFVANVVSNAEQIRLAPAGQARPPVQLVSMLSIDQGAFWERMVGPTAGCDNAQCSLHLAGLTSARGRVYSSEAAPGLMLGTGNEGKYLNEFGRQINTYLSRDAGLSWELARPGPTVFEVANHGGIIVACDADAPATQLFYSLDQGLTWTASPFSASARVSVSSIAIEPSSTSRALLLLGSFASSFGPGGSVFAVDLSPLQPTECRGWALGEAGGPDSDFEVWSPGAGRFEFKCLMGRKVELVRRRREARDCFVGENVGLPVFAFDCPCGEHDFECDVGYERRGRNGKCQRDASVDINYTLAEPEYCPAGSSYQVSKGYRLVAGDSCKISEDTSEEFLQDVRACSGTTLLGVSLRGWLVLGLFAGLGYAMHAGLAARGLGLRAYVGDWLVRALNRGKGRLGYHNLEQIPEFADDFGADFEWEEEEEEARAQAAAEEGDFLHVSREAGYAREADGIDLIELRRAGDDV